jgi:hypothetical protein
MSSNICVFLYLPFERESFVDLMTVIAFIEKHKEKEKRILLFVNLPKEKADDWRLEKYADLPLDQIHKIFIFDFLFEYE